MVAKNLVFLLAITIFISTVLVIHKLEVIKAVPEYSLQPVTSICLGKTTWMSSPRAALRGNYWVLYNHFKATKAFECLESITYVSQGEYQYLDNIWPVLQRWQGPISIAVFAPGSDFTQVVNSIQYYRNCFNYSQSIVELVTFHIFYPIDHRPRDLNHLEFRCEDFRPDANTIQESYRKTHHLDYPVNVARMIARESATTHYIYTSDIELYPSPNLIPNFLQMIERIGVLQETVFVTPIFEIKAEAELPSTKNELKRMLKAKTAIIFHQNFCEACHKVPQYQDWLDANVSDTDLSVHTKAKRRGMWEPIYIGTNQDPPYDERLSWEGRSDKMVQGFILCLLDYDFAILDSAFLIHRPGIKTQKENMQATPSGKVLKQKHMIKSQIVPELNLVYGSRNGCHI